MPAASRSPKRTRMRVVNIGDAAGASGLAAEVLRDGDRQALDEALEDGVALFGGGGRRIADIGVLAAGVDEALGALLDRRHQAVAGGRRQADALALAHQV